MNPRRDFKARWAALSARDRAVLQLGGAVIGLAMLWWILLAPALLTLRGAAQQHQRLDAQLQRMQALQLQAQALQKRPQTAPANAANALEQSVRQQLGANAQLQIQGNLATVSIQNLPAEMLAQWLTQVRLHAHATVSQARLKCNPAVSPATWSGSVVLSLPDR